MDQMTFGGADRSSIAPSYGSPFWVFIMWDKPFRNTSSRLPELSDHMLRDIGILPGKPDIDTTKRAFQETSFR